MTSNLKEEFNKRVSNFMPEVDFLIKTDQMHKLREFLDVFKDAKISKTLKKFGLTINGDDKRSIFGLAALYNNVDALNLALSYGADVNYADKLGYTALHYSVDNTEIAKILVSKGANIHAQNSFGRTPLHYAANNGCLGAVDFLLKQGVDINAKDKEGNTPLHSGVINYSDQGNHRNVIQLLIDSGADTKIKNNDGRTPLQLAEVSNRHSAVDILKDVSINHANNKLKSLGI